MLQKQFENFKERPKRTQLMRETSPYKPTSKFSSACLSLHYQLIAEDHQAFEGLCDPPAS